MAPLWGRLADRVGRKIMIERSLASFVIVMAAMAFVTEAWHVFALRAIQGLFAGYGALALTMAADAAPRDRMAFAIGTVQTAQRIGPALGPVIGGTVAQLVGLRQRVPRDRGVLSSSRSSSCSRCITSGAPRAGRRHAAEARITFRNVLALENFVLLIAVVFGLQFVDRSFGPVLPLYVAELGTPIDRCRSSRASCSRSRPAPARSATTWLAACSSRTSTRDGDRRLGRGRGRRAR